MVARVQFNIGVWRFAWICDMKPRPTASGGFIRGKTSAAISGHPDIPCFLLLDDPANKLLLSFGLGAHRILTVDWLIF
jgi:hypothetical protein